MSAVSDTSWSLGTLIGVPVAVALVAGLIVLSIWLRRKSGVVHDRTDASGLRILSASAVGCSVLVVIFTVLAMYPYSAEYHQWRSESGTVTAVDSRLLADGDHGSTQRFVVTLDGDRQRSCDDTRCAQVEVGDVLTLSCKRAWQYSGTDGYDCNFVSNEADQ